MALPAALSTCFANKTNHLFTVIQGYLTYYRGLDRESNWNSTSLKFQGNNQAQKITATEAHLIATIGYTTVVEPSAQPKASTQAQTSTTPAQLPATTPPSKPICPPTNTTTAAAQPLTNTPSTTKPTAEHIHELRVYYVQNGLLKEAKQTTEGNEIKEGKESKWTEGRLSDYKFKVDVPGYLTATISEGKAKIFAKINGEINLIETKVGSPDWHQPKSVFAL